MVRHGDAAKPIWISEMGWNVAPEDVRPDFGRVTEEQQARYAVGAYRRAQEEWPWVGVNSYWFLKRPADREIDQAWYYFRMLEPDFTPLPVYDAVAEYATAEPDLSLMPGWQYDWMRARPGLFTFGAAVLLFSLLRALAPRDGR